MRKTLQVIAILGLVAPTLCAQSPAAKREGQRAKPAAAKAEEQSARDTAIEQQLQQFKQLLEAQARELDTQRALLRAQQEKMETLERLLREQTRPAAHAEKAAREVKRLEGQFEAVAGSQKELGERVGKVQTDLADAKKSTDGKLRGLGNFTFSGDLRVRYEPFFGGGLITAAAPADRHRERFRLRLNVNAKFNDEFAGGLTIASGDPGDPISTNQTMTSFFQRKPIQIDKAFVTYTPRWFKPLSVTGGKWGYTWFRTEVTWDNDLNPEGISETLAFDLKNDVLKRVAVVAFQSPFNEVGGGPDSGLVGGQLQFNWKLSERAKLGTYAAYYHFRNADSIAANQAGGAGAGTTGILTGNNDTNAFGVIGGTRQFASRFGVLDTIARLDITTRSSRFPLMLLFDFAQNTRACQNVAAFLTAGVAPPACNPRDRQAYWAEVQLGRTQEQGDMRFGYTFIRIEREAVVSAFNFSDIRQGTNLFNHRLEYAYQANRNVTLGFTGFIGRQLVTADTPTRERLLKRLQFDLVYKF